MGFLDVPVTPAALANKVSKGELVVRAKDYGAVGDGVTDDTYKFTTLESSVTGKEVDLSGATFKVTAWPLGNKYVNGSFSIGGTVYKTGYVNVIQAGNSNTFVGRNAGAVFTPDMSYTASVNGGGNQNTAVGNSAMAAANGATKNNDALGSSALQSLVNGYYNTAIGYNSLYSLNGQAGTTSEATRNTALGSNAGRFNATGRGTVAIGRNAMQTNTAPTDQIAIGTGAMAGYGPVDVDDSTILNQTPQTANQSVGIGTNALQFSNGSMNTAVGYTAAQENKLATENTAVGWAALSSLEKNIWLDGRARATGLSVAATYSLSGATYTVTSTAHGLVVGNTVLMNLGTHEAAYYNVATVPDANTFTVTVVGGSNRSMTETGSGTITEKITGATAGTIGAGNTAVGSKAMQNSNKGQVNTIVGNLAGANLIENANTAVGALALTNLNSSNGGNNTAVGYGALRYMQDGTNAVAMRNSIGIGYGSSVSGDAQMQLGNTGVTVYAASAITTRSDERDKSDIRDTELGLDFVNKLRPVDYRYEFREDYLEHDDDGTLIRHERDGSKKRARFHHGVIAQEVEALIESSGQDFGGFLDAKRDGGTDVLSIRYEEFIGPLIKAVQELTARVQELEAR